MEEPEDPMRELVEPVDEKPTEVELDQTDFVLFQNVKVKLEKIEKELDQHSNWDKTRAVYEGSESKKPRIGKRPRDGTYASTDHIVENSNPENTANPLLIGNALIAIGEEMKQVDTWITSMKRPEAQDVLYEWYSSVEHKFFNAWQKHEKVLAGRVE